MTTIATITQETIQNQIYTIRGKQVMIDRELAILYGVETKVLNQAVKRNFERFPTDDFMFQLTSIELNDWKSQIVTSNKENMGLRKLPFVFGEMGVAMLSAILRSETAIGISIQIMTAFVEMRKVLRDNTGMFVRLEHLERKQLKTDENFNKIFNALENPDLKPKQGIFYNSQIFDAYTFIADLVRDAQSSVVLIDNYVDDTVLRLFAKRKPGIPLTIYTKAVSTQLTMDLDRYNLQYAPAEIKMFTHSHDRFLILDEETVYHIGASLKDLGKKWFAFSKMEMAAMDILSRLQ